MAEKKKIKRRLIKKGWHWSTAWYPKIHFGQKRMEHNISFHGNCAYDLSNYTDQLDVNKLFGLSFGLHHNNSARFGWRWDLDKDRMEILAYTYVAGVRTFHHICYVHPWMKHRYILESDDRKFYFSVISTRDEKTTEIAHGKMPRWGYHLNTYFGGNRRAPHDMLISFYS